MYKVIFKILQELDFTALHIVLSIVASVLYKI